MFPLFALFTRSLRELLRSKMSYWVLVAMVGVIFIFLLGAQSDATNSTAPGLGFLLNSLFVELTFVTLAAVSYFATAITEEKEEGTLGLLRMTNLDPLAILLGKSTSRLAAALLLLTATIPFTLLAITLGGVSARQIFASYLCVGAYLVLLANVALLASVVSPRGAYSTLITSGVVLGTPGLAALLGALPGWLAKAPFAERIAGFTPIFTHASEVLQQVNPFRRLGAILTTGFSGSLVDDQFWWSLLLAAILLGVSWLLFDLATGDAPNWTTPRLTPAPTSRWARFGPGRAQLVSAPAWKDFHFLYGGWIAHWAKWIVYSGLGVLILANGLLGAKGSLIGASQSVFWLMTGFLCLEICLIGGRILRSELREGTLDGLATLPLSMNHVALMKLNGARRSLGPAITWVIIAAVAVVLSTVVSGQNTGNGFLLFITLFMFGYVTSQAWLLAHLAAYFSLRLSWGALPISIAIVLLANIVGMFFCLGFFVLPIVAFTYVSHLRHTIYQRLEEMAAST